jgi:hypothetical protein
MAKQTSRGICHFIFKTLLKIKSRKSPLASVHIQQEVQLQIWQELPLLTDISTTGTSWKHLMNYSSICLTYTLQCTQSLIVTQTTDTL